jgi:hypothetical protein
VVDADPTTAFEIFTGGIGRWWPLAEFGVYGADAAVSFVDGRIVESSTGGEEAVWGSVIRWDPPAAVAFTWHPGGAPERASQVEVTFTATEGGTLVVLEHHGWEAFDDPAAGVGPRSSPVSATTSLTSRTVRPGWHWSTVPAPVHPEPDCSSTIPDSPITSPSSPACARRATWSPRARWWTAPAKG